MKIFVTHSSNFDFRNNLYLPLEKSILFKEHEIFFPQKNGYEIVTKEIIKNCDLIVAEVSFASTGQGIELGWADIFNVPIICVYKKGSKLSNSLSKISKSFIEYQNVDDMIVKTINFVNNFKI